MAFVATDHTAGVLADAVLEIRVEGVMPTAINLQVSEVTAGMLSGEGTLLHVDDRVVVFLLLLFWEAVIDSLDKPALIGSIRSVL